MTGVSIVARHFCRGEVQSFGKTPAVRPRKHGVPAHVVLSQKVTSTIGTTARWKPRRFTSCHGLVVPVFCWDLVHDSKWLYLRHKHAGMPHLHHDDIPALRCVVGPEAQLLCHLAAPTSTRHVERECIELAGTFCVHYISASGLANLFPRMMLKHSPNSRREK